MYQSGNFRFIRKVQKMSSDNLISFRVHPQKLGRCIGFVSLVKILTPNGVLSEFTIESIMMHHLVRGPRYGYFRKTLFLNKHVLGLFQPMIQCHLGPINLFPTQLQKIHLYYQGFLLLEDSFLLTNFFFYVTKHNKKIWKII